ncbi:riboflavin kinase [Pseudalkalibacillus decolorationis]|uniref:riboflavin kinase n=1 Tax=Pseudalkalibacillus decolorationis TaxID=163879 RepID=UPI002148608F|nr:riboflavin kinase [Pseudalkalibacillus decolorationis]
METVHLKHGMNDLSSHRAGSCVMALGFFDGVHLGHQQLIQIAKKIARKNHLKLAVMTFYPHPKEVISRGANRVHYLSPLPAKQEMLADMGVDKLYVMKFDLNFSQLPPQDFINQYIIGLQCKHVVAGFDFTFGYRGEGNMELLKGEGLGKFEVTTISKVEQHHQKIGSTLIRQFVTSGDVNVVPDYLGDYFEMIGKVDAIPSLKNKQNPLPVKIEIDHKYIFPKPGVYEIQVEVGSQAYGGICSQTVNSYDQFESVEVLLSDCYENVSGKKVKLKWINRVHDEQKVMVNMEKLQTEKLVI